jgi:hypothetical protein
VAGALEESEYRRLLSEAGFADVELEVTRVYDYHELAARAGVQSLSRGSQNAPGRVVSAFVRGRKPA